MIRFKLISQRKIKQRRGDRTVVKMTGVVRKTLCTVRCMGTADGWLGERWGHKRQVIVHGCAWLEVTCAINLWALWSLRASRNFHSAFKMRDKTESSAWHQQTLKEMVYASRGNKTSDRDEIKYEEVGMWNIPTSEEFNLCYNLRSEMTNHQNCKTAYTVLRISSDLVFTLIYSVPR